MTMLQVFQLIVVLVMAIFAAIGLYGWNKYKDEDK